MQALVVPIPRMISLRRCLSRNYNSAALKADIKSHSVRIQKLENRMLVVTKGPETELVSFSLSLGAGSRYELPSVPGLAHCFKHSLFMGNENESAIAFTRLQELRGSNITTSLNRDLVTISGQCTKDNLSATMQSVGVMINPRKLEAHEIEQIKENVRFERNLIFSDVESFMLEKAQELAFRRGLGNSVVCLEEYESQVTADALLDHFIRSMVHHGASAVAVGANHELFAQSVSRATEDLAFPHFGDMPFLFPRYYGGEARFDAGGDLHHVLIAYQLKGGFQDVKSYVESNLIAKLFIPNTTIPYGNQTSVLLNDGPLKNVNSISGSTQLYSEGGFLAIHLDTKHPSEIKDSLSKLKSCFAAPISEEDFAKARSNFIFDIRESYDNRNKYLELCRNQIVGSGKVWDASELINMAQSITLEDVRKVAELSFAERPTFVFYGNIKELPYADQI